MKWIAFERPMQAGFCTWENVPGRLLKTDNGRVLLAGEIDAGTGHEGSCSCCADDPTFTEYCDDLIWLIETAKRKAESPPVPAPEPQAPAPIWEVSNDGETWFDLAPQYQGDVLLNSPYRFRRRKT